MPGIASANPDAIAGQTPDLTLGPFADPVGRPVWIDLFRIIRPWGDEGSHPVRFACALPFAAPAGYPRQGAGIVRFLHL